MTAPYNERVFVCEHVFPGGKPVLEVLRDEDDGDLQALCAEAQHAGSRPHILAWGCLCEKDPSLRSIGPLDCGYSAYRTSPGAPWTIEPLPPREPDPAPHQDPGGAPLPQAA